QDLCAGPAGDDGPPAGGRGAAVPGVRRAGSTPADRGRSRRGEGGHRRGGSRHPGAPFPRNTRLPDVPGLPVQPGVSEPAPPRVTPPSDRPTPAPGESPATLLARRPDTAQSQGVVICSPGQEGPRVLLASRPGCRAERP